MPHQRNRFFDITSDTATEPTDEMFDMMKTASKGDDVFGVCKHEANKCLYYKTNYPSYLIRKIHL